MNVDEAQIVTRLILGYWPTPEMGDDELIIWSRHLAPLDFGDACEVTEMIATAGRAFRPNAGEFVAEYRQKTLRPKGFPSDPTPALDGPRAECGHSLNAYACDATTKYWMAECRRQLAEATGPLARSLSTVQPQQEAI